MRTRSNGQRAYTAFQMIVQHRSISLKSLGFPWYPKDFLDIERFCGFPGLIGWGVGILFGSPHQTAKCLQKSLFFTCLCLGSPQYTFPAVRSIPERYAVAPELIWRWSPKIYWFFVANRGYLCSSSESGSYMYNLYIYFTQKHSKFTKNYENKDKTSKNHEKIENIHILKTKKKRWVEECDTV